MNYKRKKPKQQVRCTICTEHRWKGNSRGRMKDTELRRLDPEQPRTPHPKKKRRMDKPWVVMVKGDGWTVAERRVSGWKEYTRYGTEQQAKQAAKSFASHGWNKDIEYRVEHRPKKRRAG